MPLKSYKPTTPGQRDLVLVDRSELWSGRPEKALSFGLNKKGGRNNSGRITMRRKGGGAKRLYRLIDFKRNKFDVFGVIKSIEYDPNRSSFIALVEYKDGEKRYIIAQNGLKVGQKVISGKKATPEIGNSLYISEIPLGTIISCIELSPNKGASLARSAGTFGQLMAKDGKFGTIKLPSGETRMVLLSCLATIGAVSNSDHQLIVSGKAGRSRWLGSRPRTRPVAMNPVDHPMGGGEGRASGGHPRSKKGIPAKGYKTRSKSKFSNKFIIERRKK